MIVWYIAYESTVHMGPATRMTRSWNNVVQYIPLQWFPSTTSGSGCTLITCTVCAGAIAQSCAHPKSRWCEPFVPATMEDTADRKVFDTDGYLATRYGDMTVKDRLQFLLDGHHEVFQSLPYSLKVLDFGSGPVIQHMPQKLCSVILPSPTARR